MDIKELTEKEYKSTFSGKMSDVTNFADATVDIWEYVRLLDKLKYYLNDYVIEQELVEVVYQNSANTYDHVLIPTTEKNTYLIIIVNKKSEDIFGHYLLDLNTEYGIEKKNNTNQT